MFQYISNSINRKTDLFLSLFHENWDSHIWLYYLCSVLCFEIWVWRTKTFYVCGYCRVKGYERAFAQIHPLWMFTKEGHQTHKKVTESLFMFPYCTTQGKLLTMNEDSLDDRLFLSSCQSTVFGRSERWKFNRSWSIKSHKFPINHIYIMMFIHDTTPQPIPWIISILTLVTFKIETLHIRTCCQQGDAQS